MQKVTNINPSDLTVPAGFTERLKVPDQFIDWQVEYPEYKPLSCTGESVLKAANTWADPEDARVIEIPNRSLLPNGQLRTNAEGRFLCPLGRTGLTGRLLNGKFGANPCVDVAYTALNEEGKPHVILISKSSGGDDDWMFPGGHLDIASMQTLEDALRVESFEQAAKRELAEEVSCNNQPLNFYGEMILLASGLVVPSPSTTDISWRETNFFQFPSKKVVEEQQMLMGTDDAKRAEWFPVDNRLTKVVSPEHLNLANLLLGDC